MGLLELLGYGSDKLLYKDTKGVANFPIDVKNPLTGEAITCCYEAVETCRVNSPP